MLAGVRLRRLLPLLRRPQPWLQRHTPGARQLSSAHSQPTGELQIDDWEATPQPARTHLCGGLTKDNCTQTVSLCGWLVAHRSIGGVLFMVISDWSGEIQVVWESVHAENKGLGARYSSACHLPLHSVVQVVGKVRERHAQNDRQSNGDLEIELEELRLLNPCASQYPINYLPRNPSAKALRSSLTSSSSQPSSGVDVRARYRYLDIRQAHVQKILRLRSDVAMFARQFLWKEGYVEVETPYLFKSTPEGASEFLVPTRKAGKFYALPQSPQQHKQLLMVGGVDKYFQIARCFRDEDGRADRQPEFTQIDIETSFQTQEQIIMLTEALIKSICRSREDIAQVLEKPIPRMTWKEAMDSYGSDKPDLRFGLKIHDITTSLKAHAEEEAEQGCFAEALGTRGGAVKALAVKQMTLTNRERKELEEMAAGFGAKGLLVIRVEEGEWKIPRSAKLLNVPATRAALVDTLKLSPGDLLLVASDTNWGRVVKAMGALRLHLFSIINNKELTAQYLIKPFAPLWVTDFPLFEVDEEEEALSSAHHPFTAPHPSHLAPLRALLSRCSLHTTTTIPCTPHLAYDLVRDAGALEDLKAIIGQSYDLVINGMEMGGGSIRIHTRELQEGIFRLLGADPSSFAHLLEALSFGAPPHGGIAVGMDRLVAFLASSPDSLEPLNIREVIAFPKSANGIDLLANSPAPVTQEQLARYFLKTAL